MKCDFNFALAPCMQKERTRKKCHKCITCISSLGALEFTIPSMEVLFTDMIPIISTTGAIPALPTRVSLPEVPRLTALPAWAAYPFPVKATWF